MNLDGTNPVDPSLSPPHLLAALPRK
jgi:hypothetical protein